MDGCNAFYPPVLKDYLEDGKAVINEDEIVEVKKKAATKYWLMTMML